MQTILNEIDAKIKELKAREENLQRSANSHLLAGYEDLKNLEEVTSKIRLLERDLNNMGPEHGIYRNNNGCEYVGKVPMPAFDRGCDIGPSRPGLPPELRPDYLKNQS